MALFKGGIFLTRTANATDEVYDDNFIYDDELHTKITRTRRTLRSSRKRRTTTILLIIVDLLQESYI